MKTQPNDYAAIEKELREALEKRNTHMSHWINEKADSRILDMVEYHQDAILSALAIASKPRITVTRRTEDDVFKLPDDEEAL